MVSSEVKHVWSQRQHAEDVNCVLLSHPEEGVQGPVLHELSDDPLWGATSDHALQLQHIGVVKLSQDPCFTEEHPPLSVGRPPAQSLHRHQHLPATQRTVAAPRDLPKLGWSREDVVQITLCRWV